MPKEISKNNKKPTVFMGLSGGVDSSVSAALLKKAGYDVVGVFIKVWEPEFLECAWRDERRDAMRVAAHLDIPFLTFDFEKIYKKEVADYMINEYKKGRTPNPDVMCNKNVKFGAFLKKALSMGADFVATGHYARISGKGRTLKMPQDLTLGGNAEIYQLKAGSDSTKDQSYFLWTLSQKELKNIIFPVGYLKKKEVRKLAGKFGLPTEKKKDSQGVCFLGKLNMKDFLKHYIKEKKGKVLNEKGEIIGWHKGVNFYTIGERHGFIITKKSTHDKPYYIIDKNLKKNILIVSEDFMIYKGQSFVKGKKRDIAITKTNWILGKAPELNKKLSARLRYRQELEVCEIISNKGGKVVIRFKNPQMTASAGQSLVIYDREECLGGGIIE